MALISTLAAILGGWAALSGSSAQQEAPVDEVLSLMDELAAEPRIPGTGGYDRSVLLLETFMKSRGVPVERAEVSVTRAIPTRSDVLLFEDSNAEAAFAGLRERWSPDAVPTRPLPAAYGFNVEKGDVRGPVIDAGAGSDADFKRLQTLGIMGLGKVALVGLDPSPYLRDRIYAVEARAKAAGFVGLLIAPSEEPFGIAPNLGADQLILDDRHIGAEHQLSIPTLPIRFSEAAAIRERLRVKRVRGEDGQAVSLRIGPGPVEARVAVECPRVRLTGVPALLVGPQRRPSETLLVPIDESWELPMQGAGLAAVAATGAVLACKDRSPLRRLLLAPRACEDSKAPYAVASALASVEGFGHARNEGTINVFGGRTRMPSSYETRVRAWDRRFGGELSKRAGAASTWIAYLLLSDKFQMGFGPPGSEVLVAPIPAASPSTKALQPVAPTAGGK